LADLFQKGSMRASYLGHSTFIIIANTLQKNGWGSLFLRALSRYRTSKPISGREGEIA